jgi:hypothetical protein
MGRGRGSWLIDMWRTVTIESPGATLVPSQLYRPDTSCITHGSREDSVLNGERCREHCNALPGSFTLEGCEEQTPREEMRHEDPPFARISKRGYAVRRRSDCSSTRDLRFAENSFDVLGP